MLKADFNYQSQNATFVNGFHITLSKLYLAQAYSV